MKKRETRLARTSGVVVPVHAQPAVDRAALLLAVHQRHPKLAPVVTRLHVGFVLGARLGVELVVVLADPITRRVRQIAMVLQHAPAEIPCDVRDAHIDVGVDAILCVVPCRPSLGTMQNPATQLRYTPDGPILRPVPRRIYDAVHPSNTSATKKGSCQLTSPKICRRWESNPHVLADTGF